MRAMVRGVMRFVVVSSLSFVVLAAVGCGGTGHKRDGSTDAIGNLDGPPPVQHFLVSWAIVDPFDNTTTCGQAAAPSVRVTVDATPFQFDCFSGSGTTGVVAPGSHTLNAELLSESGAVISTDGPLTTTLDANVDKTLPQIVFYL